MTGQTHGGLTGSGTAEETRLEQARMESRKAEIAAMSDAYLAKLGRDRARELSLINAELGRRMPKGYQKVIAVPCRVKELESALTTFMNSHGYAEGLVNMLPDENGDIAVFVRPPKENK